MVAMQTVVKTNNEVIEDYLKYLRRDINPSKEYLRVTERLLSRLNLMTVTPKEIGEFLDRLKKSENEDPLHKWIGTYNHYIVVLKRFFKWFNNAQCMSEFTLLRRKEKSVYKPSDLWTQEDDLLFLKYCYSKRDKCYHAISRDSSCRPSEILRLRIMDLVFKTVNGRRYAEVLINGKTGSRHIPLINSIPYVKDWLDDHPKKDNPESPLICRTAKHAGHTIQVQSLWKKYHEYKTIFFPNLLKDRNIDDKDKNAILALLAKPWNPYIRRHSALTEKSKILKESILRQHAGWTPRSGMPEKYLHYFGNESSESILEAYGLKSKAEEIDKMRPKQCPNCNESNKPDSKFCSKCRMVMSYDAYSETIEDHKVKEDRLTTLENQLKALVSRVNIMNDQEQVNKFAANLFSAGVLKVVENE